MYFKSIITLVSELVRKRDFQRAEEALLEADKQANAEGDTQARQLILSELVELYSIMDKPQLAKAESFSRERERLACSAYSKLQTAMILHRGIHDFVRAVPKLEEAIILGRTEKDERTVYTALSLLGEASLELGRVEQAMQVLDELEQMVANKGQFVVGDETRFLESLHSRQLERERVARLAATLSTACRDNVFRERLRSLSAST